MEIFQQWSCLPPSSAVFVTSGILYGKFGEELEGCFTVQDLQPLSIHYEVEILRIGILALLGNQFPALRSADGVVVPSRYRHARGRLKKLRRSNTSVSKPTVCAVLQGKSYPLIRSHTAPGRIADA